MFKICQRTFRIRTTDNPDPQLKYRVEQRSGSSLSNLLSIPAMLAGAVVGALVFSVFFAVLLIPLGIMGFKAWRLIKTAQQQQGVRQADGESITAEYTVISDADKK